MTKRNGRLTMAFVFAALLPVANAAQAWGIGLETLNSASEIQVLIKQAEQGDVSAQINLGVIYHLGEGVPQDYKQAVRWYRLAAERGNIIAQFGLGVMYAKGQGVPQDYKQAYAWFNIAGVNGHKEAQKNRELIANMLNPETLSQAQDLVRAYYERHR